MNTVKWMDTTVKAPGEATSNNQTVSEATALSHSPSHPSKKPSGLVLNLYPDSAVLGLDLESFRWQESTFAMLNLALLAALLCGHALFSEHFGTPTPTLVGLLSTGFLLQFAKLIWIQTRTEPLTGSALRTLAAISIVWDVVVAVVLGLLIDRVDSPYYVLMLVPILLASFRRSAVATLLVVIAASVSQFFVVWRFFQLHPPAEVDEYFEAGTILIDFLADGRAGVVSRQSPAAQGNRVGRELARTHKGEGTAVAGREAGSGGPVVAAIAHEIRNPVAMISSSLATAIRSPLSPGEREEMFDIAAKEAARLERLTNDFLAYAKPRAPEFQEANVMDTLAYVAGVCRAHALRQRVDVRV